MEVKTIVVLVGLTLAVLIKDSHAMKCYVCGGIQLSGLNLDGGSGSSTENCKDPFKKEGVTSVDCNGSCVKTKIEKDDNQIVARACWAVKMDDDCTSEGDGDVCYCNGDLCNAASTLKFSSIVALAIVAGSLFFQRFL